MWNTVHKPQAGAIFTAMVHKVSYPFPVNKVLLKKTGIELCYLDEGTGGETMLFIHGLANYAPGWKKNIEHLKGSYRCIAPDLPGNGLSEGGNHPYSIHYFSYVIKELLEELKITNVTLVGHSMGGQIALTLALKEPTLVKKVILCAPAGLETFTPFELSFYQTTISFLDFFSTEENSLKKLIRSSFYHYTHQADDMIEDLTTLLKLQPAQQYRKMVEACIHGMLHEPVLNSLHLITQPILILFGDRDALIPNRLLHPITTRKMAEEAVARMPDAELHIIPQAGHFLQWEKAPVVNNYISAFMKK
ncbi:MAG: alpha/beta hydrolase [Chitinophagaceae bacterium]|nr:MAG: alpha/beta hydrolase [Chitinophagaceae bacterium]